MIGKWAKASRSEFLVVSAVDWIFLHARNKLQISYSIGVLCLKATRANV